MKTKCLSFLLICLFPWIGIGQTVNTNALNFQPKAGFLTYFSTITTTTKEVKLSRFIENIDLDFTSIDLRQATVIKGKNFWKVLRYYDVQNYLKEKPYRHVLYPNLNYPGGYFNDEFSIPYLNPTPFHK